MRAGARKAFSISAASSVVTEAVLPTKLHESFFFVLFFRQREKIILLCGRLSFDEEKFDER